jgi:hypothetical protein
MDRRTDTTTALGTVNDSPELTESPRRLRRRIAGATSAIVLAGALGATLFSGAAGAATPGRASHVGHSSTPALTTQSIFVAGSVKVPTGWKQNIDSKHGFDTWYNPAHPGERVVASVCYSSSCAKSSQGRPVLAMPFAVNGQLNLSNHEIAFHINSAPRFGAYAVDGVLETATMGFELAFPVVIVTTSVPTSMHSTATAILNSLNVYPPASCGG